MTAPFSRVDHLVIAVRDLAAAEHAYSTLLGRDPSARGAHPDLGTENVVYGLANCYLELLALGAAPTAHPVATALAGFLARKPEGLFAIALGSDDLAATADVLRAAGIAVGAAADLHVLARGAERAHPARRARLLPIADTRGVTVFAIEHDRSAITDAPPRAGAVAAATAVDHVVIFTDDLAGALRLWRDAFAIPERWRREFPDRGTVNVGLRLGHLTLELVTPLGNAAGERGERLWGIAYAVDDCEAAVARARAGGVPVSDVRNGLAPATRVASVKWQDRVPTLLIEHTRASTSPRLRT